MVIFDTVSMLFWGCFFMLRRGFAFAPQSTRLRDHKSTSLQVPTAQLCRLLDHKTTRLQVATAVLVVSLTSCLVVLAKP